ncbi:MAG: hypothetical protein PHD63_04110 [Candidatus Marinimicrobia bacterium]|nr:hypothetical protein [Candidatus Neomarinimicrobiota bacterium]
MDGGIFKVTIKNKKYAKSNMVQMRARVATVYRLLLSGMRRREIIQYVAEKTDWGVSTRTIENYIHKATAEIKEVTDEEIEAARGMAYKRLDTLYYKSLLINDYKTALAVQKEMNDLFGLKTTKIEHSGDLGVTIIDDVRDPETKQTDK